MEPLKMATKYYHKRGNFNMYEVWNLYFSQVPDRGFLLILAAAVTFVINRTLYDIRREVRSIEKILQREEKS
jgi:hypothetical protein